MNPTPGDVHVNGPLGNISVAFIQDASVFVATKVFPNVPVSAQSDLYYAYDRGDFNRSQAKKRAPGGETAGGGFKVDPTANYFAPVVGFHQDIPDQVRANANAVINPDRDSTYFVTHQLLLYREKDWVSKYFAGGIWTNDKDGVASGADNSATFLQWNDPSSTPIENVTDAATVIQQSTGFRPNVLVMGRPVFDKLKNHPDIVDRVKYGQTAGSGPARVTKDALAALFEIERIEIMEAIENTGLETTTFEGGNTHAFIGGKKALLAYAAPVPGMMVPTAGYTFSWTGYMGASQDGTRIKKFRIEKEASDRVEGEIAFDQKLISADLGYFWDTIVA